MGTEVEEAAARSVLFIVFVDVGVGDPAPWNKLVLWPIASVRPYLSIYLFIYQSLYRYVPDPFSYLYVADLVLIALVLLLFLLAVLLLLLWIME